MTTLVITKPANARAIRFFFDGVYVPCLATAEGEWCMVSRDAERWVEAEACRYASIREMGFVENLYSDQEQS